MRRGVPDLDLSIAEEELVESGGGFRGGGMGQAEEGGGGDVAVHGFGLGRGEWFRAV